MDRPSRCFAAFDRGRAFRVMPAAVGPVLLLASVIPLWSPSLDARGWVPTPAAASVTQEAVDEEVRRTLATFVDDQRRRLGLPGIAVSIGTSEGVVFAMGSGERNRAGDPINDTTPFFIGSVTKTFTAALTADLAASGALDLDAPVEHYLPSFRLAPPYEPGTITIRHLATHTSGLSGVSGHDRRAQEEAEFDHIAPRGPPGEGEYSSLNFIVLGRVIEEVSGRSYDELLRTVLFGPLAMSSAFVERTDRERPSDLVQGHQSIFGHDLLRVEPAPPRHLVPAGFAGASANGLARYGGMLIGGGSLGDEPVLAAEAVTELLGPMDAPGRALGWGRARQEGVLRLEHAGNSRTNSARVRLVPEQGYAIVVLTNTNTGPFFDPTADIVDGIESILLTGVAPSPFPWERVFKAFILLTTVFATAGMLRRVAGWWSAGRAFGLVAPIRARWHLLREIGLSALVVLGLPRFFGVTVTTLIQYFPDLGYALVVSVVSGLIGSLARAMTPVPRSS